MHFVGMKLFEGYKLGFDVALDEVVPKFDVASDVVIYWVQGNQHCTLVIGAEGEFGKDT